MRGLKKELKRDMELEMRLLTQYKQELSRLPKGSLSFYRKGGRIYYKHIVYQRGRDGRQRRVNRHLGRGDSQLIYQLQRKAFLKESIKRLEKNLKGEGRLEQSYLPYDYYSIWAAVGEAYRPETTEEFLRQEGVAIEPVRQEGQTYKPEHLKQPTSGGFLTRSKGEALIAEALMARGIVFQFEHELKVRHPDGRMVVLHPDFWIPLRDGSILLWEHLGLLKDWGYATDAGQRLFLYGQAGYYPGVNLILTADDGAGNTDMNAIARILDWLETVCLFRDPSKNPSQNPSHNL